MDTDIFTLVKVKVRNIYNKNFKLIVFSIFLIRILYAFFSKHGTYDLNFYNEIANGITNNCGIGTISPTGECNKIVGHFFPGFFYLMALSNISGAGDKGLVILISMFGFFSSLLLGLSIKKYTKNIDLAKSTFILMLSGNEYIRYGSTIRSFCQQQQNTSNEVFNVQIKLKFQEFCTHTNIYYEEHLRFLD